MRRVAEVVLGLAIRVVSAIVPSPMRAQWRTEWRAELVHAWLHGPWRALRHALGLVPDALACRRLHHGGEASLWTAGELWSDVRRGGRLLARSPGFALFAIAMLGLGIGSNTAMFSIVERVLLRPLPLESPDRLVQVWERRPRQGRERNPASYPDFVDWRMDNRVFDGMAAYENGAVGLEAGASAESVDRVRVTHDFFDVLGLEPILGRGFDELDDRPGAEPVVLLSYELWQSAFGGRRSLLGETIRLDGEPHTVIGVLGEGAGYPWGTALWQPLAMDVATASRGSHRLHVVARLADGATLEEARVDLVRIASRLEAENPRVNEGHTTAVHPLHDEIVGDYRQSMTLLFVGLFLLLLIVCANLASLQLSRAVGRRHEMVVRTVLGATRGRLARELILESALLAVSGCVAGVALARLGLELGNRAMRSAFPWLSDAVLDLNVIVFAIGLTVVVVFVTGLTPAFRVTRIDSATALRDEGRSVVGRASRSRSVLVVVEFVLALLLLVGAGLTGRTLLAIDSIDPGFETRNVMTADVWFSNIAYDNAETNVLAMRRLEAGAASIPGVEAAGLTFLLPMSGRDAGRNFGIEGRPTPEHSDEYNAALREATSGYFDVMGIPLLHGRLFESTDIMGAPYVAVINRKMATMFWPDSDPIGARLLLGDVQATIVGIVGDVRHNEPQTPTRPEFYLHLGQVASDIATIVVRSSRRPADIAAALRDWIHREAPDVPVSNIVPMASRVSDVVSGPRVLARLVGGFALIALLLSTLGIYGVMSWSVAQRRREIGLRLAIGGAPARLRRMVLRDGLRLIAVAIPLGLAGAAVLARAMQGVLFGVQPADPVSFVGAAALLSLVGVLATLVPAVRATRVDPARVLRE